MMMIMMMRPRAWGCIMLLMCGALPPYLDDEGGVGRDGHLGRGGQPLLQLAEGSRSNRAASSATGQGESEWPPDMMGVLI